MKCEMARPLLAAYSDGEASPKEKRVVDGHLKDCPACVRELRWLGAMSAGLKALPEPAVPAGLTDDLLRLARQRRPRELSFWEALRLTWRMPAGLGLASAVALGIGVLVFTQFLSEGKEEISLDEVLAAHSRYALTMPAADRETLYTELGAEVEDDI